MKAVVVAIMMQTCAAVEDPDARLQCYDAMAAALKEPAGEPAPKDQSSIPPTSTPGGSSSATKEEPGPGGAWRVTNSKSKIDDSETVVLWINPAQPVRNDYGAPLDAYFAIVCEENSTRALVFADRFLGSGSAAVVYRLDSDPASRIQLQLSTDRRAVGWWSGAEAIAFVKKLFGRKTLTVRLEPSTSAPIDPVFPIAGVEDAIKPLRKACNW